MNNNPDKLKLLAGIEAARPGRSDLDLPELQQVAQRIADEPETAALYQSIQDADMRMVDAFAQVDVPAGLQDRLLASLTAMSETAEPELSEEAATQAPITSPVALKDPAVVGGRSSRRMLTGVGLTAACLMLLVVAGMIYQWASTPALDVDQIVASTLQLRDEVDAAWNDELQAAPASHPVSSRMQMSPISWTSTAGFGDQRAVAYRFESRAAAATLFVFQGVKTADNLPAAPPTRPQHASGAAVGTWVADDLLYVLVVDGTARDYQRFVRTAPGLAVLMRPQSLPKRYDAHAAAA